MTASPSSAHPPGEEASPTETPALSRSRRFPKLLVPVGIGLLALGGWGLWQLRDQGNPTQLELSGRLEGYPTNVDAKVSGRIKTITVREGESVTAGQVIAQLDDAELQAQQAGASAQLKSAQDRADQARLQLGVINSQIREANLVQTQAQGDSSGRVAQAEANLAAAQAQLAQAQAQLQESKAQLSLAQNDRDRFSMLYQQGAVSGQQFDQVNTTFQSAQETVHSREAAVEASQRQVTSSQGALTQARSQTLNPAIRTTQIETLQQQLAVAQAQQAQAEADVATARASLQEIDARLQDLEILSPIDGVVLTRSVEPGTVLSPGTTLLTVIDPSQVYMRGFIPEGQIGEVRVGQPAQVVLDSFPDHPLRARVRSIDSQASFTPENIYFKEDRVRQVFGVELAIDNPDGFAKPGMPADGAIHLEAEAPNSG